MTKDAVLMSLVSIGAFAGLLFLGYQYYAPRPEVPVAYAPSPIPALPANITLPTGALEAQAAILYDPVAGRVLYAKNDEAQLPLASLTKLATALAALSQGENQLITIAEADLAEEGDSGLAPGQTWRLSDLVAFSLTTSSNDGMAAAARALTRSGTVEKMNADARAQGLTQSYFLNPTGLDLSSSTAGAYGSARDVAALVERLLRTHPDVFEATAYGPAPSQPGVPSTLLPMHALPGFVAGKTGYTDLAGGNLAAVIDIGLNEPLIAVVLGSSRDGRFTDVATMIEAAKAARIAPIE